MDSGFTFMTYINELYNLEMNVDTIVITLLLWFIQTHVARIVLSERNNRLYQFLNITRLYHIYFILISLINLVYGKTAGRFYTVLVSINSIFISFCICILNPFHLYSSRFPALESMTNKRFIVFAIFQAFTLLTICTLHLSWCYFIAYSTLMDVNKENINLHGIFKLIRELPTMNRMLHRSQQKNKEVYAIEQQQNIDYTLLNEVEKYKQVKKFSIYVGLIPCNLLCYTAFIQLIARTCQAIQGSGLYPEEMQQSNWKARKVIQKAKKIQKRIDKAVAELIKERASLCQ